MRRLSVFNQISLNGYFSGANGDLRWAHRTSDDAEFHSFVEENARGGGVLLMGRVTYELMIQYWPTPAAKNNDPVIAEHMNNRTKVVFSKTLDQVSWKNTRVVKDGVVEEVRKMKKEEGDDLVALGSGSIASQLAQAGLIDEYQLVVSPVVLAEGRSFLYDLRRELPLKLASSRTFHNGSVLLTYQPA